MLKEGWADLKDDSAAVSGQQVPGGAAEPGGAASHGGAAVPGGAPTPGGEDLNTGTNEGDGRDVVPAEETSDEEPWPVFEQFEKKNKVEVVNAVRMVYQSSLKLVQIQTPHFFSLVQQVVDSNVR